MKQNVTFSIGNISLVNKADEELNGYFQKVFGDIGGKARDFIPCVKLLFANRLGECLAISRLNDLPDEYFDQLGFKEPRSDRTLNRTLERIGMKFQFVMLKHQEVIKDTEST